MLMRPLTQSLRKDFKIKAVLIQRVYLDFTIWHETESPNLLTCKTFPLVKTSWGLKQYFWATFTVAALSFSSDTADESAQLAMDGNFKVLNHHKTKMMNSPTKHTMSNITIHRVLSLSQGWLHWGLCKMIPAAHQERAERAIRLTTKGFSYVAGRYCNVPWLNAHKCEYANISEGAAPHNRGWMITQFRRE